MKEKEGIFQRGDTLNNSATPRSRFGARVLEVLTTTVPILAQSVEKSRSQTDQESIQHFDLTDGRPIEDDPFASDREELLEIINRWPLSVGSDVTWYSGPVGVQLHEYRSASPEMREKYVRAAELIRYERERRNLAIGLIARRAHGIEKDKTSSPDDEQATY